LILIVSQEELDVSNSREIPRIEHIAEAIAFRCHDYQSRCSATAAECDIVAAIFSAPDCALQSYQTEISKQLRLLEIDVIFLQGARQASTARHRLDAIGDRLRTLIEYSNAILQ
jgi:hypothetical protein